MGALSGASLGLDTIKCTCVCASVNLCVCTTCTSQGKSRLWIVQLHRMINIAYGAETDI